ncbi:MAG: segregation/condensation protein A [Patescibacteria group bacterium]|jgi:segregation and condensation protein A
MSYKIKLEQFEGPLDLLLQLIEQEKLDITELSLAKVTFQYLEYLNNEKDIATEELADFLVIAAKLLLIKSRLLLPQLEIEDEEGIDLESQLKIYREFYEASKVLTKMIGKKKFLFPRERMVIRIEKIFNPPKTLTAEKMKEIFSQVLHGLEVWVNLPQEVLIKTISIKERIANIQSMISQQATLRFGELLRSTNSKTEIIVTFLALLELVKQRTITVVQESVFDEIVIKRLSGEEREVINENPL